MATKASRANDTRKSKAYEKKSIELLKSHDKIEKKIDRTMTKFLKTKWSAIANSKDTERGRKRVESLIGLTIDINKVDEYEKRYSKKSRYAEGYEAEREHVKSLRDKYK